MRYHFVILLCLLFLCGCAQQAPLRQSEENIVKVELIDRRDSSAPNLLATLSGEQVKCFIEDLNKIKCFKRAQPQEKTNNLEIRIYYSTGEMDFLGSGTNGYLANGKFETSGWYYYHENELAILFDSYSD